jgi:hypothetical protein
METSNNNRILARESRSDWRIQALCTPAFTAQENNHCTAEAPGKPLLGSMPGLRYGLFDASVCT